MPQKFRYSYTLSFGIWDVIHESNHCEVFEAEDHNAAIELVRGIRNFSSLLLGVGIKNEKLEAGRTEVRNVPQEVFMPESEVAIPERGRE